MGKTQITSNPLSERESSVPGFAGIGSFSAQRPLTFKAGYLETQEEDTIAMVLACGAADTHI